MSRQDSPRKTVVNHRQPCRLCTVLQLPKLVLHCELLFRRHRKLQFAFELLQIVFADQWSAHEVNKGPQPVAVIPFRFRQSSITPCRCFKVLGRAPCHVQNIISARTEGKCSLLVVFDVINATHSSGKHRRSARLPPCETATTVSQRGGPSFRALGS